MMQRIIFISIALIYLQASLYAASTSELKEASYPDPENVGEEKHPHPAHGNVLEQTTIQTPGNVLEQTTIQTPENVMKQSTNQTAEHARGKNLTHPTMSFEQIVKLTNCSVPRIPENGGLVCVYFDNIYYCKPMCNPDYDFAFLRRSRLYEECGSKTAFTWTTQYIGGSRLAECIASEVLVSGQSTAYFKEKKCLEIVSDTESKQEYIDDFIIELGKREIQKNHKKELDFVACGRY